MIRSAFERDIWLKVDLVWMCRVQMEAFPLSVCLGPSRERFTEARIWCQEQWGSDSLCVDQYDNLFVNTLARWHWSFDGDYTISFRELDDAIMFKLRWL